MNEILVPRAHLLIEQGRFEEAGKVLTQILATEPNNVEALALNCEVHLQLGKLDQAEDLINQALALSPDDDQLYYYAARVALLKHQFDKAESLLQQAIQMDPACAPYYAFLSSIKLSRKKYQEALNIAEQALDLEPDNIVALNTRSTALLKLDRREESFKTIEGALHEDPNNAYTHTNYGWALLEKGDPKKALGHFREALRNNPDWTHAQMGMIEALKARYVVYRLFLKYSFWINNLAAKFQWAFIVGFYLLTRSLDSIAENNPALGPYLQPMVFLLAFMAFSTWVITPISNLFLRLNTFGRHLLSEREKKSSNFVGASLLLFVLATAGYFTIGGDPLFLLAVFGFTMMVPLSVMFSPSRYKNALLIYALGMALLGITTISLAFNGSQNFQSFVTAYVFGFIGFQWVANFLLIKESNY